MGKTKSAAERQREWRNRQDAKGRIRRFDRKVTPEEYETLDALMRWLRGEAKLSKSKGLQVENIVL